MTIDTNVLFYATERAGEKAQTAKALLPSVRFISVQVLSEYANAARRKLRREWAAIEREVAILRDLVAEVLPIDAAAHREAVRIAARYELSFFDAQMLAVAVAGGATTIFSEDMHDGLVIDDTLTIRNPFRTGKP